MEKLIKFSKKPILKSPYMIVAWPGMGEVAFKAATYLIEKLKAEEFAQLQSKGFFYRTASIIQDGLLGLAQLPYNKFFFWKNPATKHGGSAKLTTKQADFVRKPESHDLIIFLSNAQPDLGQAGRYANKIISLAKSFKVQTIFSFASMPLPIDHTVDPEVWVTVTDRALLNEVRKYNLKMMSEGQISGMNGLFLGLAKAAGVKGICILSEIPLYTIQIENPKAAYAILNVLKKIWNIPIDLTDLEGQAHFIEGEINKLVDYLKSGTQSHLQPIGDEEIERIKKHLSLYTKLPGSIKTKVEKLFEQAKRDISKANELKRELDHWNVYKEYEDRFLDLFKKSKDKGN